MGQVALESGQTPIPAALARKCQRSRANTYQSLETSRRLSNTAMTGASTQCRTWGSPGHGRNAKKRQDGLERTEANEMRLTDESGGVSSSKCPLHYSRRPELRRRRDWDLGGGRTAVCGTEAASLRGAVLIYTLGCVRGVLRNWVGDELAGPQLGRVGPTGV
jgi:hypothetical protein